MAKPDYFHELKTNVALLNQKVERLEELRGSSETQKTAVADVVKELALLKQQLVEQSKRLEGQQADQGERLKEWDRRLWGLGVVLIGALLSLAAGLIVTLSK